jgi:hypothetical protein
MAEVTSMQKFEITKADVEAYVLGCVRDPEMVASIEHAREFDPVVRRWFAAWDTEAADEMPDHNSDVHGIVAKQAAALADRYCKEIAVTVGGTFPIRGILRNESPQSFGGTIPIGTLFRTEENAYAYADVLAFAGDAKAPVKASLTVPNVNWNQANDLLEIQFYQDTVPKGIVQVRVYRQVDEINVEELVSKEIKLKEASIDGKPCWYQELTLRSLVGDLVDELQPGTTLIFCVDPNRKQ